jgi:hypothetical protein
VPPVGSKRITAPIASPACNCCGDRSRARGAGECRRIPPAASGRNARCGLHQDRFTKTLSGDPFPESVWKEYCAGDALQLLGIETLAGRVFAGVESADGRPPRRVALLSHGFWQRRFAGEFSARGPVRDAAWCA